MDLIGEYICVKSISFSFRLFERGEKVNIYRSGDSGYYADGTFGSYLTEYIGIIIVGIPMFLFIRPIKNYRKRTYKHDRYVHLKWKRMAFPVAYGGDEEREEEFLKLDRYFKVKELNKKTKKWNYSNIFL